jgi:hypothetical protein
MVSHPNGARRHHPDGAQRVENVRALSPRPALPAERGDLQVPYYEFVVRGDAALDVSALESETGLRCIPVDRAARLDGELIDRAALHGAIERLYRLDLDLLALERRSGRHAT